MDRGGWQLDPDTLAPVVVDRARIAAELTAAGPLDRLWLLRVLGRADEALAEAAALAEDPVVAADPWRLLLLTAELRRSRGEPELAERCQVRAWRHALGRERQASTLHQVGVRWYDQGELHRAGQHFELARVLRRGFADPAAVAGSEQALAAVRSRLDQDAIVLAGGRGVRLGGQELGAKALVPLAGWPLADHVLLAASGAGTRIQVGPRRIALAEPVYCREQPAGGGPVAAIAAALRHVRRPTVAVLAGDLPFVCGALGELGRAVAGGRDAAALVDLGGRTNYLAACWRTAALRAAVDRLGDPAGQPVRALYDGVDLATVPDFDACSADVDTPDDRRAAEQRISSRSPGQLPESPLAWPRLELHAPS